MADSIAPQLPRGRHGLTREQVETDQRLRIFVAMADAMRAQGYVGTPVAEIIKRAASLMGHPFDDRDETSDVHGV